MTESEPLRLTLTSRPASSPVERLCTSVATAKGSDRRPQPGRRSITVAIAAIRETHRDALDQDP